MTDNVAATSWAHGAGIGRRRASRAAALLALILSSLPMFSRAGLAADADQAQTAGGVTAYLGIVPAAIIKAHPGVHVDPGAHGGAPAGRHEYHVLVALFDAKTGARIADAKVTAQVSEVGLAGPSRTLEPMKIAGTVTYGNYFQLPSKGSYRIGVEVEHRQAVHRFSFSYEH
jgi:hypothetical protein